MPTEQLPMTTQDLPTFDHPHSWTWRNNMPKPSRIHVEPAFKAELGEVFILIDQGGEHLGIWLPRDAMEAFIAAMRAAADAPEYDEDER